jgi:hypothetical protein
VTAVKKLGLKPERFAGGHGTVDSHVERAALAEKPQ